MRSFLLLVAAAGTASLVADERCTKWRVSPMRPSTTVEWCFANCYTPGTLQLHPACSPETSDLHRHCYCESTGSPCSPPEGEVKLVTGSGSLELPGVAVTEGMTGWGYGSHTVNLRLIPALLRTGKAHMAEVQPVQDGAVFEVTCNEGCEGDACEVFLAVHHCNAECSQLQHGKLIGQLSLAGWQGSSCSPVFTVDGVDQTYKMVTYRTRLLPGETLSTPPAVGILNHVVLFTVPGKDCASLEETACDAAATCVWKNMQCVSTWCPKMQGPHGSQGSDPAQCACPPTVSS